MYSFHQLENVLFIDIETATMAPTYEALSDRMKELWDKKSLKYMRNEDSQTPEQLFEEKAGIHAEFGKIVCISCGFLRFTDGLEKSPALRLKSFFGLDEYDILSEFSKLLFDFQKHVDSNHAKKRNAIRNYESSSMNLCAHNGKEFDFPYLGRRYIIQGLPIPNILEIQGKKPWEVNLLDTMELWKFGDYKAYTSLDLLAAVLDIPSPKDDIDGSQISKVYWEEEDYPRIKEYCEKDVLTTVQILLKMSRLPLAEIHSSESE